MGVYVDLHSKMFALWFPYDELDNVYWALCNAKPFYYRLDMSHTHAEVLNVQAIRRWSLITLDHWPESLYPDDIFVVQCNIDDKGNPEIAFVPDKVEAFAHYGIDPVTDYQLATGKLRIPKAKSR